MLASPHATFLFCLGIEVVIRRSDQHYCLTLLACEGVASGVMDSNQGIKVLIIGKLMSIRSHAKIEPRCLRIVYLIWNM